MRRRQILMALGVLALVAMIARHPSAGVRVLTHDMADPSPRKVEAAVDMGLFAMSLLVTWTARAAPLR